MVQIAEIKTHCINSIQATQFPITKNGVYKAFDYKRYQWYEFEDSPSFWTKLVNIEGKTSKIRSHTKESRLQVKN